MGMVDTPATNSSLCPPSADLRNLALSFWQLTWAQLHCTTALVDEEPLDDLFLGSVVAAEAEGICQVTLRRPGAEFWLSFKVLPPGTGSRGDAGLILAGPDAEVSAVAAAARRSAWAPWEAPAQRLCLVSSRVGSVPLISAPSTEMLAFATTAINAARAQASCGGELVASQVFPDAPRSASQPMRSTVLQRAIEVRFPMALCAQAPTDNRTYAPCHGGAPPASVMVAMELVARWDQITRTTSTTLQYLGSEPTPCHASERAPEPSSLLEPPPQLPAALASAMPPSAHPDDVEQGRRLTEAWMKVGLIGHGLNELPERFSFGENWPGCRLATFSPRAQGLCASSWAAAAVGAWEKQACALSGGARRDRLSLQWFLDCAPRSSGCGGGRLEDAFELLYKEGAVSEQCLPSRVPFYAGGAAGAQDAPGSALETPVGWRWVPENGSTLQPSRCQAAVAESEARACRPGRLRSRGASAQERLFVGGSAAVGVARGATMIQAALLSYAAVASVVEVYVDFLDYGSKFAIYRRAKALSSGDCLGLIAVQLLGWGVGNGDGGREPYWLGEAPFGSNWSENGYFRWVRGGDHLGVESRAVHPFVHGTLPAGLRAGATASYRDAWLETDRLANLADRAGLAEIALADQRRLQNQLLVVNAVAIFSVCSAFIAWYIYKHNFAEEFVEESASARLSQRVSARLMRRQGATGHCYAPVATS